MGRLEKIVVVTVLFLVAVILGVSLNSGGDESGKGPLGNHGQNGARAKRGAATEQPAQDRQIASNAPAQAPSGVLNAAVAPAQGGAAASAPAVNAPATSPVASGASVASALPASATPAAAGGFLVTREGLEPSTSDDWMLYTWKAGDTFKDLAQRYYGSPLHVARLRSANEGRDETKIAPGEKILIAARSATALEVTARTQPKAGEHKQSAWAGGLYEVKAGDVLGTISQQVYGTSKSWKKIYDANRDVIGENPNALKVGAKLRIPE